MGNPAGDISPNTFSEGFLRLTESIKRSGQIILRSQIVWVPSEHRTELSGG